VGHVARLLEEAGMATVIIGIRAFQRCMAKMMLPRVVVTPHLMGRSLGTPGNYAEQRKIILAALDLLERASRVGTIVELPQSKD
jgi:hypothetical protein